MPHYVTRAFYVEDEHFMPDLRYDPLPSVSERDPRPTGLLDSDGNELWRLPDPIGFGRRKGCVD